MLLAATATYLLIAEIAVRLVIHAPLSEFHDFRHERAARTINHAVEHDDVLGWHIKPYLKSPTFNTLQYGLRSNGDPDAVVQPGGVLAVGSSFTAGSEVADDETWPAQLEQMTGWNVHNAGEGAFNADQIILNGEKLLPIIHPQVLIVDVVPGNIVGAGYSSYGWPKPYFTVENGRLVQHNVPVPMPRDPGRDRFGIKPFLGHFAIADQFMTAFFSNSWFASDGTIFERIDNDVVDVTCRLLERLKQEADANNVGLVLYLQFGGPEVRAFAQEAVQSTGVAKCAQQSHIVTVDEFAKLRAIYDKSPSDLNRYYRIEPDGQLGHKSPFGNLEAAKALEPAIKSLEISIDRVSK
jgi:hypothetical protein